MEEKARGKIKGSELPKYRLSNKFSQQSLLYSYLTVCWGNILTRRKH